MHPAVYFLAWLTLLIVSPWINWQGLLVGMSICMLGGRAACRHWWRLIWRAKILLLTLALLIGYSVPGVLLGGYAWAPSHEGMLIAGEQVLRLMLLLGALALLLNRLPRTHLMLALWAVANVLLPQSWANRSVARLALVFQYIEKNPEKIGWRDFLGDAVHDQEETMRFPRLPWRRRDGLAMTFLVSIPVLLGWLNR